jgi:hypothetical protein
LLDSELLPPDWELRFSEKAQKYYYAHEDGHTYFSAISSLPLGWVWKIDEELSGRKEGKVYFCVLDPDRVFKVAPPFPHHRDILKLRYNSTV